MHKSLKIIKYLFATFAVFVASLLIGQKNSKDYSIASLVSPAHADIPAPSDSSDTQDSVSDTDSDSDSDSDSVGNDGVGVDGASDTDGPGDSSCTG